MLQVKLKECEEVLENDYFLAALKDDFVENARLFIFETYCRIHQCIDMRMLSGALLASSCIAQSGAECHVSSFCGVNPSLTWMQNCCTDRSAEHGMICHCCCAGKLNMDEEAAEKWIVNLIRNARLNAKIDSQAGTVVMGMQFPSAYEQVMEKAKGLSQRTFMLANLVVGAPQT